MVSSAQAFSNIRSTKVHIYTVLFTHTVSMSNNILTDTCICINTL